MSKNDILKMQRQLAAAGFYSGEIDGIWGPATQAAHDGALAAAQLRKEVVLPVTLETEIKSIAWSAKVSPLFVERVVWIAQGLGLPEDEGPDWVMACIAFETGETFSASVKNPHSQAIGLIQFMPKTAIGLGTSVYALALMSPEDQLNYVYKYFSPYKGKIKDLQSLYMAILWPAAVSKPDSYVLWNQATKPTTYFQNRGLDVNKNGTITKGEAASKVEEKLTKGRLARNMRSLPAPT